MKSTAGLSAVLALAAGVTGASVWADSDPGLAGKVFAIEAEVLFSPSFPAGTVLNNCYTFNEDGTWDDPYFPDPYAPLPGVWVQHTDGPRISYTAVIADWAPDLWLVQNGSVKSGRGASAQRLQAHSMVFVDGETLIAELVSYGREVEECPF